MSRLGLASMLAWLMVGCGKAGEAPASGTHRDGPVTGPVGDAAFWNASPRDAGDQSPRDAVLDGGPSDGPSACAATAWAAACDPLAAPYGISIRGDILYCENACGVDPTEGSCSGRIGLGLSACGDDREFFVSACDEEIASACIQLSWDETGSGMGTYRDSRGSSWTLETDGAPSADGETGALQDFVIEVTARAESGEEVRETVSITACLVRLPCD